MTHPPSGLPYTIQTAKDSDSPSLSTLIFDIWREEYKFQVSEDDYPDLKAVFSYYSKHNGKFFIAIDLNAPKQSIVGTAAYEKVKDSQYALKRMFVHSKHRGKGIAQALLNAVIDDLKGNKLLFLSTKSDLAHAAKRLYLKNNFHVIPPKDLPDEFPIFYQDDLFMKRVL